MLSLNVFYYNSFNSSERLNVAVQNNKGKIRWNELRILHPQMFVTNYSSVCFPVFHNYMILRLIMRNVNYDYCTAYFITFYGNLNFWVIAMCRSTPSHILEFHNCGNGQADDFASKSSHFEKLPSDIFFPNSAPLFHQPERNVRFYMHAYIIAARTPSSLLEFVDDETQ